MRSRFASPVIWPAIVGTAVLSVVAMYLYDPDRGRRRRAIFRDKARRSLRNITELANVSARDMTHRLQGLRASARHLLGRRDAADDLVLIERVRAKMGRVVSHPHAIQIGAREGRITLSGPILAHEARKLLDTVRSVWGVSDVDDHLVVYDRPNTIPSLQGGRHREAGRAELFQENWTPAVRVAAVLGGGALAICAVRQRGLIGVALGALSAGLATRGASNVPLARLTGLNRRRAVEINKTVHIAAPREMVYDLWSDPGNFPRFMSHVKEVRDLGGGRFHWVVSGPAGASVEWDAVVTRAVRPKILSWRTEPSAVVQHSGSVQFEQDEDGTRVTVHMTYNPLGGFGHALATLLGTNPKQQMDDDLARMKAFIEQGVPPRDAAQRDQGARTSLH